ncbi:4Fe-4S dicluster domain-containing protein [Methanocaldococcus infernus]
MINKILSIFKKESNKNEKSKIENSKNSKKREIYIDYNYCKNCLACYRICKLNVFDLVDNRVKIVNKENCVFCEACLKVCRYGALKILN